jgi:outer membrane biosynthesis protein TonB
MWHFGSVARLFVFGTLVLAPILTSAQQSDQSESTRKVLNKVTPRYPELARTMSLKGVVKVEAVVDPKGGHPVLVQAAQNAIRQWKYAPSSHETRETIEIQFNPPQ